MDVVLEHPEESGINWEQLNLNPPHISVEKNFVLVPPDLEPIENNGQLVSSVGRTVTCVCAHVLMSLLVLPRYPSLMMRFSMLTMLQGCSWRGLTYAELLVRVLHGRHFFQQKSHVVRFPGARMGGCTFRSGELCRGM